MQVRAGVAQFAGSRNWEENIAAVSRLATRAAENGVQLLGFHELASTIYPPFSKDPALYRLAEPESGPSVSAARKIARQGGLVVVYPFFERAGERYYNSAVVIGPHGEVLMKYRKTHVPASVALLEGATERDFFEPGDLGYPTVATPFGVRLGVIICYDRNLPEPARCATLNGAEVLFVPVTTIARLRPWWEVLLRARAVENILYVCAPSRVGEDQDGAPDTAYIGESLIVDPMGKIIGQGSAREEDLVAADLDIDFLRKQRDTWPFLRERRPELYGVISAKNA